MTLKDAIKQLQQALNDTFGAGLTIDGVYGPKTAEALQMSLDSKPKKPVLVPVGESLNPAFNEAKKYEGKGEKDSAFVAFMAGYWKKVGLPNYKTIVGASFAWCGLFVVMANTNVGQEIISGAAGAKSWAKYGVAIDYKKNGAPRGAVIHINHAGNCNSGSSNHVAFLDGDCTAQDLTNPKGFVRLYGGNQGNTAKVSSFSTKEICEIRWPKEIELPGKIEKSIGCSSEKAPGDSTK